MKRTRRVSAFLSVCMAVMCMAGMSVSASADQSLFDCEIWVDAYEGTVSVAFGDEEVPEDAYTLIFFSYEATETGENLERVGEEFPTEDGTYIATVTAKEGSGYTDAGRSEPFTISGGEEDDLSEVSQTDLSESIVYVTVESKNVTVRLSGGLVPSDAYHVIFFSCMATRDGEKLERIGEEFPTEPGPYIAAVVANEGSGFTGENRSDTFTVEPAEEQSNPKTGAELPGIAVLAVSAAAIAFTAKRKHN